MKAKAPERIWIDPATDLPKLSGHIDKDSVEYTRTDVFIEKAAQWLTKHTMKYYLDGSKFLGTDEMVEDFKIAMKL